jgi:hypothetical protein
MTVTVTDGAPNYQSRVDGGSWNNFDAGSYTATITGLYSGFYLVEVKDATGCTYQENNVEISREIYTPINIGTVFATVEPTCGKSDGSIQVIATGGSGSYEYSVNGGTFTTYTDGLITGLAAGTYTIAVRDANSTSCPEATINNIVLHNGNTDLMISVTSDNASTSKCAMISAMTT